VKKEIDKMHKTLID